MGRIGKALFGAAALLAIAGTAMGQGMKPKPGDLRVTLLGTGTPPPLIQRFGPSTLVQAGGLNLLFDCGRGCTQRLWQKKVPLGKIDALFLTHLHSDHVVGIPDLLLTGWLRPPWAHRDEPLTVIGPEGTVNLMTHIEKAYEWDIKTRINDQKLPPAGVQHRATNMSEGVVLEKNGVKVTAFAVNHGAKIKPAFGFRIDFGGRSVVISGDTKPDENLIKHAQGVDLLIHQVAMARPELLEKLKFLKVILDHHTKPAEAGTVFSRVKPKLAVFYHIVSFGNRQIKPYSMKDLVRLTRQTYSGPLLVGSDLTSFDVAKSGVTVLPK